MFAVYLIPTCIIYKKPTKKAPDIYYPMLFNQSANLGLNIACYKMK